MKEPEEKNKKWRNKKYKEKINFWLKNIELLSYFIIILRSPNQLSYLSKFNFNDNFTTDYVNYYRRGAENIHTHIIYIVQKAIKQWCKKRKKEIVNGNGKFCSPLVLGI